MNAERTVYFGSFVQWTDEGREQLRELFHDNYFDKENVPFIGYDPKHHVFSIRTNEPLAVQMFASTINAFMKIKRHRGNNVDILSPELFKPIECTTLPDFEQDLPTSALLNSGDLITVDEDSDEDSTDNTSSGGVPSLYWRPHCGDISILPDQIGAAIATLTECMLYKEPESHRVRLINGDVHRALEKLQRMELLLERAARHASADASAIDYNLLSFSSQLPGTGVVYVSTRNGPHCDRIMVSPALERQLENMSIGEEYVYSELDRRHVKSPNLLKTMSTSNAPARASKIWTTQLITSSGNPDNALPRTPSGSNTAVSHETARSGVASPPSQPNKFLGPTDQARLREWSRNVDAEANPGEAAEEPVEQEPASEPVTRRLVEDSDSDAEIPTSEPSSNPRLVAHDSEEDEDQLTKQSSGHSVHTKVQLERASLQSKRRWTDTRQDSVPSNRRTSATASKSAVMKPLDFWAGIPRDEDGDEQNGRPLNATSSARPQADQGSRQQHGPAASQSSQSDVGRTSHDNELASIKLEDQSARLPMSPTLRAPNPETATMHADATTSCGSSNEFDTSRYSANRWRQAEQQIQGDPLSRPLHAAVNAEPSSPTKWQIVNKRDSNRRFSSQQTRNYHTAVQYSPVESWPRPAAPSVPVSGESGNRSRFGKAGEPRHRPRLVDIPDANDQEGKSMQPPPGLSMRTPYSHTIASSSPSMDCPPDQTQRSSLQPTQESLQYSTHEDMGQSAPSPLDGRRRSQFEYIPQTRVIRPDLNMMHDSMLYNLMGAKYQQAKLTRKCYPSNGGPEKIEEEDEISTREFHKTMNLKTPNPGKAKRGKGSGQLGPKETAAQRAERISKAKAEAFGPIAAALPTEKSSDPSRTQQELPPSRRAQDAAKKKSAMAASQADMLGNQKHRQIAQDLASQLTSSFEAARCFSGELSFELQLGQLLVEPHSRIKPKKIIEKDKWTDIFIKTGGAPHVSFNGILTNDGGDVDGMLEMNSRRSRSQKVWNKEFPGPDKVAFEFQCLDITGLELKVFFRTDGSYYVHGGPIAISKIGIQCPGRVWDVCAVLGGSSPWKSSAESLELAVKELISSVYIRAEGGVTLFFRIPSSNALTVQDVLLRRKSWHDCLLRESSNLQLQITETTRLYTKSHRLDKRLHYATIKSHETMVNDQRIHYQVAVVDKDINNAFEENLKLEVGEMTSVESTGASLLTTERTQVLVDMALHVVDKIDWVGWNNYGTLIRQEIERKARYDELARTLPPTAVSPNFARPVGRHQWLNGAGSRTVLGTRPSAGIGQAATLLQPIHGVRTGTQAQIFEDAQGNRYKFGQGAARIPVPEDEEPNIGRSEIQPNDSASQAGRHLTERARQARRYQDDKPPGFW